MSSEARAHGRIFPLYVAPIDWYFLCDDSTDYPMVFYVDLDFNGRLDKPLFDNALEEALGRHPLLYAIVQPAKQNKPCWVLAPDQLPRVAWSSDNASSDANTEAFIDIRRQPGLRIWACEDGDGVRMTMQFHHATCDGTGAYRFVGDLLGCYMNRLASCAGQVDLGPVDLQQLKVRPTKMRSLRVGDSFWQKTRSAYAEAWRTFGHRVAPLKPPQGNRIEDSPSPTLRPDAGMVKRDFSGEQLANLRQAANAQGATFNDLLLSRMFQTVAHWNTGFATGRKFRVMVPSDMRDGEDFEMPACNMTAYTFINRTAAEIVDADQLLDLIRIDTLQIKNGSRQKSFMDGLTSAMSTPAIFNFLLHRNACLATSVLSNAGDPARRFTCRLPKKLGKVSCDEFTLDGITGVPPLRRMTRCTLSSSIYGRKLTFSMRCDPHCFSTDDSRQLLDLFCTKLSADVDRA